MPTVPSFTHQSIQSSRPPTASNVASQDLISHVKTLCTQIFVRLLVAKTLFKTSTTQIATLGIRTGLRYARPLIVICIACLYRSSDLKKTILLLVTCCLTFTSLALYPHDYLPTNLVHLYAVLISKPGSDQFSLFTFFGLTHQPTIFNNRSIYSKFLDSNKSHHFIKWSFSTHTESPIY